MELASNASVGKIDALEAPKQLPTAEEHKAECEIPHEDHPKVIPTEEDLRTLRRVAGKLPWACYTVTLVELCERFSYYGTIIVFVNFIQRPLPAHSTTGALSAVNNYHGTPGALGMGQRASTGLTLFNQFWAYVTPLFGAFVADQYLGRFRTIFCSLFISLVGHAILLTSAIPKLIASPHGSLACFTIGLIIMGVGTGGFKSNISPLIAEQYRDERSYVKVLPSGERVIVDHAVTITRIYHYFYLVINVGSLAGQISMVYAERYVGFWLSFLLPTAIFCLCPLVLFAYRKSYYRAPRAGSVYAQAWRLCMLAMKGRWSLNPVRLFRKSSNIENRWDLIKPSRLGPNKPTWMTFDDVWVDEVRRGLYACKLFLWLPLFWLAYNQTINNLTSQAATMRLGGVPNDIITNLNPIALIIFIPIFDKLVYPGFRRLGFNFTPVKRITAGLFISSASMVAAAVIQHYVYKKGPCGKYANKCLQEQGAHSDISVWVQVLPYVLGGISELTSITSLEYAYTKAPRNMRSLVQAVAFFMIAFSSAIGQAFVSLSEDPLLVWNYTGVSILAFAGGVGFWLTNHRLGQEEDGLSMLPQRKYEFELCDQRRDSTCPTRQQILQQ